MSRRVAIAGMCVSLLSLQLAMAQYGDEASANAAYDARFVFARIRYGGWSSAGSNTGQFPGRRDKPMPTSWE